MQKPKAEREAVTQRTLKSLTDDLLAFRQSGGDIKNAKHFNNVIHERLFNIPIDQVALPALHISLGTFLKIFNMLETACSDLDIKLTANGQSLDPDALTFIERCQKLKDCKWVIKDCEEKIELVNQALAVEIFRNPENANELRNIYEPRIVFLSNKLKEKSNEAEKIQNESGTERWDGPCTRKLDETLKLLNVERQAYHGRSFVGNHVHKMLKDDNIMKLCNSIPELICHMGYRGTDVHKEAIGICVKFKKLFWYYAQCHALMNSREKFDEKMLNDLETAIENFMNFYRKTWPDASITPKLHMLENHAIDFVRRWGTAFGFYGEQGAESIHPTFNKLMATYCQMKPPTKRLQAMMNEHLTRVHPRSQVLRPSIRKRKHEE
ncbi:uncharacterized protein LOC130630499 [Hydractinia symbiolongicarpus]|uniref:uncharacterized protein LOC130630499 n=1 Tax=Hydractinia symbiolongicarpus TaxID=13093 RepID=UPI00254D61B0|nr:uncharacterized protein LOC130630499 [Hydractinia symbiolongicarpus]